MSEKETLYLKVRKEVKEKLERIAKELMELKTIDKPQYNGLIQVGVNRIEVYDLKPTPNICMYCPFFERG